ncbi:MAG: hypothetical protein U7126_29450 [Microcoleus sp.]
MKRDRPFLRRRSKGRSAIFTYKKAIALFDLFQKGDRRFGIWYIGRAIALPDKNIRNQKGDRADFEFRRSIALS